MTIFTDAGGRPIERPARPGPHASPAERLAYMRALAAYNDRIADTANQAFDRAFREALRGLR